MKHGLVRCLYEAWTACFATYLMNCYNNVEYWIVFDVFSVLYKFCFVYCTAVVFWCIFMSLCYFGFVEMYSLKFLDNK